MSLSIITPHFNNFNGLQVVNDCLLKQTSSNWEWVIVDDCSNDEVLQKVKRWYNGLNDDRVKLVFNSTKTNASVCRNLGVESSCYDHLVFLDSDDIIAWNFVANRQVICDSFLVYGSYAIIESNGTIIERKAIETSYLNKYLSAHFLWQTTCFLWRKSFFMKLKGFHPSLPRLQDVELAIRAFQESEDYKVITDNPIDFYYCVKPIRERSNLVKPVCIAVNLLLSSCLDYKLFSYKQRRLLSGYYFSCVRYFERSESMDNIELLRENLNICYSKRIIHWGRYLAGVSTLKCYYFKWLSPNLFLRINRRLFKPQ